ncbi:hypothetical protein LTR56_013898 [Elasticomyces elasticus]|nr:hypothetical protein LTR56_013898 [Elasticomyces elasticus]KAK3656237.1 hypothetical protein LTR22_009810 [Elasticomyces elasticus]KAK4924522.1 hypothetical protein LTR49_008412 [Elasticomyces elasticus]KAK5761721.1 hypothetical protein LTS12_008154 [Elasticomyces elasticus]
MAFGFSEAELRVIILAMHSVEGGLAKVDTQKLAELGGFKNKASANAVWYSVKKKMLSGNLDDLNIGAKGGATGGKKRAAKEVKGDVDHEEQSAVDAPPAKRGRKANTGGKARGTKTEVKDGNGDDDELTPISTLKDGEGNDDEVKGEIKDEPKQEEQ